jgi:hypothetical protein
VNLSKGSKIAGLTTLVSQKKDSVVATSKMAISRTILLLFKVIIVVTCANLVIAQVEDLCNVPGCSCTPNALRDDLIDVNCQCPTNDQVRTMF